MYIRKDIIIFIIAAIALGGAALVVHGDVKLLDGLVREITVVEIVESLQTETSSLHRSIMSFVVDAASLSHFAEGPGLCDSLQGTIPTFDSNWASIKECCGTPV